MTRVVALYLLLLTSNTGLVIGGFSIGSRNREYPGSYSSSGFVGLGKDTQSELSDQLTSGSNYGGTSSHQYSTSLSGRAHSSPGSSYTSGGNEDTAQSNGFGSHSSNNPDALNSITASSYTNDAYTTDVSPGYSSGSSNSDGYSNGHGSTSLVGYSGHSSNLAGLSSSANEHNSAPSDYAAASSSSSSSPYVTASPSSISNYGLSGHKTSSAYAAISKNHGHNPLTSGAYSLGSSLNLIPNSHPNNYQGSGSYLSSYPGSHLNSYPGSRHGSPSYIQATSHSGHKNYPEATRFASSPSLNSYLTSHSRDSPNSFIHSAGPPPPPPPPSTHRNVPPFLHGTSSNLNMNFVKGPNPFYTAGNPFPKSGSKLIIIKDGPPSHGALMHSAESNFPSGMFAGNTGGYKVRSAGPFSSGSHFNGGNYRSSFITGYPGAGGHHPGASPGSSFFGYQ